MEKEEPSSSSKKLWNKLWITRTPKGNYRVRYQIPTWGLDSYLSRKGVYGGATSLSFPEIISRLVSLGDRFYSEKIEVTFDDNATAKMPRREVECFRTVVRELELFAKTAKRRIDVIKDVTKVLQREID